MEQNICFISLSYLWAVMSAFLCTTLKWQILGFFKVKNKGQNCLLLFPNKPMVLQYLA